VRDEFAEYKKEKSENCSMLDADLRRMREELFEAKSQAAKLASHEEYNSEKFKIIQNNCLGYKRQVEALEMRNKQLDLIAAKHEASVSALRDELSKSFNQVSSCSSSFYILNPYFFAGGMILELQLYEVSVRRLVVRNWLFEQRKIPCTTICLM
jgi:hypothetical protein